MDLILSLQDIPDILYSNNVVESIFTFNIIHMKVYKFILWIRLASA